MKRPSALWLPTAALLLQGGDDRIAAGADGRNRYGCAAVPDGIVASFGSSTASSISEPAFAAADRLRRQLLADSLGQDTGSLQDREGERIGQELKHLCGVADIAGLGLVLAASGTDLHRLAAQIATGTAGQPAVIVMMEASETGSGVAAALSTAAHGSRPMAGQVAAGPIDPAGSNEPLQVRVRNLDGSVRPEPEIEAEIEALAARSIAAGRRVLLIGLDLSKTGLLVPAPAFLAAIRRRWPARIDVLIDACQFRLSVHTLRRYLDEGFLIAVTGSKFFTGPSFCAALFIPPMLTRKRAERPVSPVDGAGTNEAISKPLFQAGRAPLGLILRWEAALEEMRRWTQVPAAAGHDFVAAFAAAVGQRLASDPAFEPLPAPPLARTGFADPAGWDSIPTIFPFLLRQPFQGRSPAPISRQQTEALFHSLASRADDAAPASQFGQPVRCGERAGVPVSALRICLSARLIVEATVNDRSRFDAVIGRAMTALDQLALHCSAAHDSYRHPQHV